MIVRLVRALLFVALTCVVTGENASAEALRKVTIGVGTQVLNVTYPWLLMPVALDWWKQQGLDVNVIAVSGSLQATQLLAAGTIDFAEMNASAIIQANVTSNVPVRAIMENAVLDWSVVTLADGPIKKPADFKGKTIGVMSLASSGNALLKAYLVENGIDADNDVQIVATGAGAPALQALKSGRVQGLMLWASMNTFLENQGVKLTYFFDDAWRSMPDFSLATLQSKIDADPALVRMIAAGAAKASAFTAASPDCVRKLQWAHFPDTKPSNAPSEAAAVAWDTNSLAASIASMKSSYTANGNLWGATTAERFDRVQQFMFATKQIAKTVPPANFVIAAPNFFQQINDFDQDGRGKARSLVPRDLMPASAAADAMIEIADLTKSYPTREGPTVDALGPLSATVRRGEFLTIVGPSGCGKSTFLKILAGTSKRSSGSVRLLSKPLEGPDRDIGMVFQTPVLLPWRTVEDNVLLPIELQKQKLSDHRERAAQLFRLVGLQGFERKYPNELSGGMQQRAGIIRALIHDPAVLLLDEPFGALDAMTREHMNLELLNIWRESRKTVILVTHSIPEAIFLADRVLVMSARPGRIAEVIDIDLPRPRSLDLVNSAPFGDYVRRVRSHFGAHGGLDA